MRGKDNSDVTGKAESCMFIGVISTCSSHRSVWVATACTRIYHAGLYQAQHEPRRIRGVYYRGFTCRRTENVFIRYGTPWHAYRRGGYFKSCTLAVLQKILETKSVNRNAEGRASRMGVFITCIYLVRA